MLKTLFLSALALSATSTVLALPTGGDTKINWTPCNITWGLLDVATYLPPPYPYQCANLSVPLDYTDPDSTEALVLNLVRVEALNKPAKGSIFFNPGGPGASGIEYVLTMADVLHEVLGGSHDLIGFDPRGTGKTIPFNCNRTDSTLPIQVRDLSEVTIQRDVNEAIEEAWPENMELASECLEKMNERGSLIGTAFVARDMLQIVDALGEDGLLHYWGTSYGTVLGGNFAAMFPDRVGRVLLDSNVNLHDWRSGYEWERVADTDKAFLGYLEECVSNPDKCAIARHAPSGDAQELLDFYNSLKPLLDEANAEDPTALLDWHFLKTRTVELLYTPGLWAYLLGDVLDGYINQTLGIEDPVGDDDNSTSTTPDIDPEDLRPYNEGVDSIFGIMCGDSHWRADSPEALLPVAQRHWQISSFADVAFPSSTWACAAWKMQAKEIYEGPFSGIKTKNPVMLVNGIYDPVTPWVSADNNSAAFEGSALLKHKGFGHGVNAHPSVCSGRAIRAYFEDGTVPEKGTECEPDVKAFDLPNEFEGILPSSGGVVGRDARGEIMGEEDVRLYEAMREMGRRDSEMRRRGHGRWL